jgi:hypothetical protein
MAAEKSDASGCAGPALAYAGLALLLLVLLVIAIVWRSAWWQRAAPATRTASVKWSFSPPVRLLVGP